MRRRVSDPAVALARGCRVVGSGQIDPRWGATTWSTRHPARGTERDTFRWAFLEQFYLDKLSVFLIQEREAFGDDQCRFIRGVARIATDALFDGMPPLGPLHLVN